MFPLFNPGMQRINAGGTKICFYCQTITFLVRSLDDSLSVCHQKYVFLLFFSSWIRFNLPAKQGVNCFCAREVRPF
jgi:hypothetical protein